mmetsp:Transcript_4133/g.10561  ORF Transcript_4133/g.10561 Transcript_4133/m.10561 type:complete len:391 (+) Transcript_4133:1173-2345(+)
MPAVVFVCRAHAAHGAGPSQRCGVARAAVGARLLCLPLLNRHAHHRDDGRILRAGGGHADRLRTHQLSVCVLCVSFCLVAHPLRVELRRHVRFACHCIRTVHLDCRRLRQAKLPARVVECVECGLELLHHRIPLGQQRVGRHLRLVRRHARGGEVRGQLLGRFRLGAQCAHAPVQLRRHLVALGARTLEQRTRTCGVCVPLRVRHRDLPPRALQLSHQPQVRVAAQRGAPVGEAVCVWHQLAAAAVAEMQVAVVARVLHRLEAQSRHVSVQRVEERAARTQRRTLTFERDTHALEVGRARLHLHRLRQQRVHQRRLAPPARAPVRLGGAHTPFPPLGRPAVESAASAVRCGCQLNHDRAAARCTPSAQAARGEQERHRPERARSRRLRHH